MIANRNGCFVHHVKKARKDNAVCKKGESYYWVKKHPYAEKELYKNYEDLPDFCKPNEIINFIQNNKFSKYHKKEALRYLLNELL